jgi:nucleoside-triphosphatase THEP1
MTIKDAKQQIKNAMSAYFTLDEYGRAVIPTEHQRPVFLIGPPGIGKTAIMEQIAEELGVGLLSYSMTHHTRQSALGLPVIKRKIYDGTEYDVSEYTMSEIIASVYDRMEQTGVKQGILFLDEINCVSETLAPVMLQFLQYKVFGRHKVPDGWIVVTAGNPPEYNKSVRDFDIVTWDRLKRIDVEPDYRVWKEYAYDKGVHPAVLTYLDLKRDDFYSVETTVSGKTFVTARGWVDLSDMIYLYELKSIKVDELLISQYLQKPKIAKEFSIYYDLFNKYRSDYQVEQILAGTAQPEIKQRAAAARFDERLVLLGLLLDAVSDQLRAIEKRCNITGNVMSQSEISEIQYKLENIFRFCEQIFTNGQELLILVTELTINPHSARFIAAHGCDAYFRHNKDLLFHERNKELINEIEKLQNY